MARRRSETANVAGRRFVGDELGLAWHEQQAVSDGHRRPRVVVVLQMTEPVGLLEQGAGLDVEGSQCAAVEVVERPADDQGWRSEMCLVLECGVAESPAWRPARELPRGVVAAGARDCYVAVDRRRRRRRGGP